MATAVPFSGSGRALLVKVDADSNRDADSHHKPAAIFPPSPRGPRGPGGEGESNAPFSHFAFAADCPKRMLVGMSGVRLLYEIIEAGELVDGIRVRCGRSACGS